MIAQNLLVYNSGRILNKLYVNGIEAQGDSFISNLSTETLNVLGDTNFKQNMTVGGNLSVEGDSDFQKLTALTGYFTSNQDPGYTQDGALSIGNSKGTHLSFGKDRIQGRSGEEGVSDLYINNSGGAVYLSKNGSIYANDGSFYTNSLDAKEGEIKALSSTSFNTEKGEAHNFYVLDELRVNKFSQNLISANGGSMWISPTIMVGYGSNASVYIDNVFNDKVNLTITDSQISSSEFSGITWFANSKVKLEGRIGNVTLGSRTGRLISRMNSSSAKLQIEMTYPNAEDVFTVGEVSFENLSVMLYEIASNGSTSIFYPVGIYLSSYGRNKKSYIDIFGGTASYNNPHVRIGLLNGLPKIGNVEPTGWGIATTNGYFSGVLHSTAGIIGGWTIGSTSLTSNVQGNEDSLWLTTANVSNAVSIGNSSQSKDWRLTVGGKFGIQKDGTVYASNIIANGGTIGGCSITDGNLSVPAANISGILSADQLQVGQGDNLVDLDELKSLEYNQSIYLHVQQYTDGNGYSYLRQDNSNLKYLWISNYKKSHFTTTSILKWSFDYISATNTSSTYTLLCRIYYFDKNKDQINNKYDGHGVSITRNSTVKSTSFTFATENIPDGTVYYRLYLEANNTSNMYYTAFKNMVVKEKIVSDDLAEIGGWTIGTDMLYNGTLGANYSTYLSTKDMSNIGGNAIAGENNKYWRFTIGSHFGVNSTGILYCDKAVIAGEINATSGEIGGCEISDGNLIVPVANITGTLTADRILVGQGDNLVDVSEERPIEDNQKIDGNWIQYTYNNMNYLRPNSSIVFLTGYKKCNFTSESKLYIICNLINTAAVSNYNFNFRIYYYDQSKTSQKYDQISLNGYGSRTDIVSKSDTLTTSSCTSDYIYYRLAFYNTSSSFKNTAFKNIVVKEKQTSKTIAEIGGWSIGEDKLYYNSEAVSSASMVLSPNGTTSTLDVGGSGSNTLRTWAMTIKNKFGVTTGGALYANDAHISGDITANSLTLGSNASISGTIYATGGEIGGCSIVDGKLQIPSSVIIGGINQIKNLMINTYAPDVSSADKYPRVKGQPTNTVVSSGTVSTDINGIKLTLTSQVYPKFTFGTSLTSSYSTLGLTLGETYTLSFSLNCKLFSNDTSSSDERYLYGDLYYRTSTGSNFYIETTKLFTFNKSDKGASIVESDISWTFTVPQNAKSIYLEIHTIATNSLYAAGDYLGLRYMMLEKGETMHSYTPAIDDISVTNIYKSGTTTIDGGRIATDSISASAIDVSDLSAFQATIGGWNIGNNGLYYYSSSPSSNSITLSSAGINSSTSIGGSSGTNTWAMTVKNGFGVTTDGKLYCKNAKIQGDIVATSLTLADGATPPWGDGSGSGGSEIDVSDFYKINSPVGTPSEGNTGFKVSSSGLLTAANAIIYGTIYASEGEIGGCKIANGTLTASTMNINGSGVGRNYIINTYVNSGIIQVHDNDQLPRLLNQPSATTTTCYLNFSSKRGIKAVVDSSYINSTNIPEIRFGSTSSLCGLKKSTTYTFSFSHYIKMYSNLNTVTTANIVVKIICGNTVIASKVLFTSKRQVYTNPIEKKDSLTFTIPNSASSIIIYIGGENISMRECSLNDYITLNYLMLEEGEAASMYNPAPEDSGWVLVGPDSSITIKNITPSSSSLINTSGSINWESANGTIYQICKIDTTNNKPVLEIGDLFTSITHFDIKLCTYNMYPTEDNECVLGLSDHRFARIFATEGTIQTSDEREKDYIYMYNKYSNLFMSLKPIEFTWKNDSDKRLHLGIGAQTLEKSMQELGYDNMYMLQYDKESDRYSAVYTELQMLTIPVVQDHEYRIRALEEENEKLRETIKLLTNEEA